MEVLTTMVGARDDVWYVHVLILVVKGYEVKELVFRDGRNSSANYMYS